MMTESLAAKAGLKQNIVCLGNDTKLPQENKHLPSTSSGAPSEMMPAPQVQDDVAFVLFYTSQSLKCRLQQ